MEGGNAQDGALTEDQFDNFVTLVESLNELHNPPNEAPGSSPLEQLHRPPIAAPGSPPQSHVSPLSDAESEGEQSPPRKTGYRSWVPTT